MWFLTNDVGLNLTFEIIISTVYWKIKMFKWLLTEKAELKIISQFKHLNTVTCNYFHMWSFYMSRPLDCHGEPPWTYSLLSRLPKSVDTCGDIWNQHSEEGSSVYWALDYPTVKMNISNFPNDCDQLNGFNIQQQWCWIFKKYIAYHTPI
mgnify:CR=1 FL=1